MALASFVASISGVCSWQTIRATLSDMMRHLCEPPRRRKKQSDYFTRAVEARDDAARDGIDRAGKDDRNRPRLPLDGDSRRGRVCQDDVGLQTDQLLRKCWYPVSNA
jgi:hypothetical protein